MGWWIFGAVLVAIALALLWLRRTLVVVTVDGPSMEPSYQDGATVLVRRVTASSVKTGQVVMIAPPHDGPSNGKPGRLWLMKRVAALAGDPVPPGLEPALADLAGTPVPAGQLIVLGDNPEASYDSREEGFVAADRIRGTILLRVS